jgi:2-methylcitrate dehydratase PrpD
MDAILEFVRAYGRLRYEDIPAPAVAAAKQEVLDSLAAALGGSGQAGIGGLAAVIKEWGGSPQATVIAYDLRCPAPFAAQVNASMTHALDYDDGHQVAQVHIGCVAVPTCLAAAERMGGRSGRDIIAALATGADFLARLGLASHPGGSLIKSGWHPTPLFGHLGAALMAGRLIGLDEGKMVNALGIAYHQCAGNSQCVNDGALTKRMGPGLAARSGLTAALMAERGITGAHNVLEGEYGLFRQFMDGDYDRTRLLDGLGKTFEGVNVGFKPYPCCGFAHAFIDAALALRSEHNVGAGQIKNITAYCGDTSYEISQPPEVKSRPRNPVDAQFSLPWTIATALVRGRVTPEDFTQEAIRDKAVLSVAARVRAVPEPAFNRHGVGPGKIMIEMADGAVYTEEVEHCLGSIERPMGFDDCAGKFRQGAAASIKPLPADTVEEVITMIEKLETLDDATAIIRRLG